jgi:hypothetical protein
VVAISQQACLSTWNLRFMGGSISALAFPAPACPLEWYEDELLQRPDLVWLTTSHNERIPAIHIQHVSDGSAAQSPDQERLTIIYSHGNAEDISLHLPLITALADKTGCDVLSYEYVGYSLSKVQEGHVASEAGCLRSIQCAWRYLVDERAVPPNSIIIYGRSIGSGPSVDLASCAVVEGTTHSPLDARGVLLQSPISSGARAILGKAASVVGYPLDIFRNYMKIGKIQAPVAITHGTLDEVVPCENGRALHAACQQPFEPLWLEGRGHNDMPYEEVLEYARSFIDALRASAGGLPTPLRRQ